MTVKHKRAAKAPPSEDAFSEKGRSFDEAQAQSRHMRVGGVLRDYMTNVAYHESRILAKFKRHGRDPWSIDKMSRLADVIGPWRRDDVAEIDLASLLKVDEWCECQAQLGSSGDTLTERTIAAIKADAAWLEMQLADCPAQTIFGVIAKLMVWRRKNARLLASDQYFGKRHALAYAAYADLFRLTGLIALTTAEDRQHDPTLR